MPVGGARRTGGYTVAATPVTLAQVWKAWSGRLDSEGREGDRGGGVSGSPDFGQEVKLGLLLRRTDLDDEQTEAVFGAVQGEGSA